MPYELKKVGGNMSLRLKKTGKILAKKTTKKKALAQIQAIEISKKNKAK